MSNRLARFRDYMARFDAAASPAHAIERGFYVERPGRSVADEITARLELRPSSTHLLVGGVGSGKTTQLLVAHERVSKMKDVVAIYVDVTARHDIAHITPGVLVALAAHEIGSALGARDDQILGLSRSVSDRGLHVVVLLDSLDRISDPVLFDRIVESDIAALHQVDIGVVLVGPLRSMYGADRTIFDRFDYFYHQPVVDAQQDAAGFDFLLHVLRARADADILPDATCHRLAAYSGGVLRDLITLAQAAGEEAYLAGADQITEAHVETAADAFGRKHLLGLGPDELEVLQRVRTKGIFVQTSDKDLALLVTRRVLEYQNGRPRYAVHPTIRPLLEQLAEKP